MAKMRFNKHVKARVNAILSKMTLAQKIGQMTQAERTTCTPNDVYHYQLGSILSAAGSFPKQNELNDWVEMCDDYWYASTKVDQQHLGIPILYGVDAIHGHSNVKDAVIFPHNIGLGATDDFSLIKDIAKATAKEVLATGVDWVFAPNLAVARDYNWGRTYESFSEDPKLVSKFAKAMIKGLQGKLDSEEGVLACAKHWVGDGGTLNGIDQGDAVIDWNELEKNHIFPYYEAINAGAMTIMVSFSSWNGEKCHANKFLLNDTLKQKMQFDGFLLSDMQGIDYLADDFYLAVAQGVNAGIDMFMVPGNWQKFIEHLTNHVELGTVPLERINDAVKRILSVKIASGLFDKPAPSERVSSNSSMFGGSTHRKLAQKAVQKSLVLLKNENDLLPLNSSARILVAGKNAHCKGSQCGGFTITWQGIEGNDHLPLGDSIWQGIKKRFPHAQLQQNVETTLQHDADFDAAIMVIGESPYAEILGDIRSDDALVVESGRYVHGQVSMYEARSRSLALGAICPQDANTIQTLNSKGIPVITVLVSGRPLLIEDELSYSNAFIAAWLPGSEGSGIADVLCGNSTFSGKLAFSWPKASHPNVNVGDRYYHPLFPTGYGLSYKKRRFFNSTS
ncbi:glycoside hydrolase family 3 protein [Aliiglaciecola sp.]|nr:glycoside hydrolase family 3 protein [Aliiglaciecola sp.]